jgi:excisionase family DNA binding protein
LKNKIDSSEEKPQESKASAQKKAAAQLNSGSSMHNLMTVKETAEYLRIPLPTVYYLVQRGQLPAVQIGGRWRVKKDAIDRDVLRADEQGQPTVLVVDDDLGLQSMFKLFLKKQGFSRLVVGTGKEAIAALQKQKFDLCFLDLQLPDFTGDEVYRQAKEIDAELPIVIITGFPDSQMLDNILKHGPVTVLKKPLEVEKLQQTLRLMGHKQQGAKAA